MSWIEKRNCSELTELFWRRTGSSVRLPWVPASGKFSSNNFILLFTNPVALFCRHAVAHTCSCLNQIIELNCSFKMMYFMFTFGGGRLALLLSMRPEQQATNYKDYSPKTHLKILQVASLFIFLSGMRIIQKKSIMEWKEAILRCTDPVEIRKINTKCDFFS